jgi:hypothetical protein
MPIVESILAIWGVAVGTASGGNELRLFLKDAVKLDAKLTELVNSAFLQHMPRLRHLCLSGEPSFDAAEFRRLVSTNDLNIQRPSDLPEQLLPILKVCISAPTAIYADAEITPVYLSILQSAVRGLWKTLATSDSVATEILLRQNSAILDSSRQELSTLATISEQTEPLAQALAEVRDEIKSLAEFSQSVWDKVYDRLLDTAPPSVHTIDQRQYHNPFLLARAEDFNHNYDKLAKLFQNLPEWDAIQSRTENVFVEGGRGTGKSMILRRLTAQATIAAHRISDNASGFDDISTDYFGVYVKLTRGYYDQFQASDGIEPQTASLLAQHELNIEIFDAFIDTVRWLLARQALPASAGQLDSVARDLSSLFDQAPAAQNVDELYHSTLRFEQSQILTYYRMKAFGQDARYQGSARPTVAFIRSLSQTFRSRFFPKREVRLFLLIDEFESLLREQQVALNTTMKMRLPDVTLKIGVRRSGRKTSDTFTIEDPIQTPRDYTAIPLDYDITASDYANLLAGIADKRLRHSGYVNSDVRSYLANQQLPEATEPELETELNAIWASGRRSGSEMNAEFKEKYRTAAVYRILSRRGKRKSFAGFDHYVTLSSGIVSNFIELCKYAFYFALSDQLPLYEQPAIPPFLQTDAVYAVSQRLLQSIDGNVPIVGSTISTMVTDIGSILRKRLLNHTSEPEANRLAVAEYGSLSAPENQFIALVMDSSIVWSVLHLEPVGEAFLPKNAARPPHAELIINRVYCPALGISPRARWRARLHVADLRNLVDPEQRLATYRRLERSIGMSREDHPGLFDEIEHSDD